MAGEEKNLLAFIFKNDNFSCHKKLGDLQLLIIGTWCLTVITKTAVVIVIWRRNKLIWLMFSAVYSMAKTPDGHAVFSDGLANCIFPPSKAMSDKLSEVRRTEQQ